MKAERIPNAGSEIPTGPLEKGEDWPVGRSIMRRLRWMIEEDRDPSGGEGDVFEALYLTERGVCIPEHLLGEDLMEDIISLFYFPLSAVREELQESTGTRMFISVFVEPSYVNTSFAVMVSSDKALLTVSAKAWNFFWTNEEEMAEELERWYKTAEGRLTGGPTLSGESAWALRTILRHVQEEDIPRLQPERRWMAEELRRAADVLSGLLEEPPPGREPPEEE